MNSIDLENNNSKIIIFVGGIHGVGKSTLCKKATKSNRFFYNISASNIIYYNKEHGKNKKVQHNRINSNQDILNIGIKNLPNKYLIIDGHFILINSSNEISFVPKKTFLDMQPSIIIVITNDIKTIANRLENRDKIKYNIKLLSEMQQKELSYAKEISNMLNIPFMEINAQKSESALSNISSLLSKYI